MPIIPSDALGVIERQKEEGCENDFVHVRSQKNLGTRVSTNKTIALRAEPNATDSPLKLLQRRVRSKT